MSGAVAAIATVLLFLTVWIVVPGWTYSLLVLSVGATEHSAWLLGASVIVCAVASAAPESWRPSPITFPIALLAAVIASIPLARAPSAIRGFDAEMTRALGDRYLDTVPSPVRREMRKRPLSVIDLFRGIDFGDPRIVRGVPFASPDGQRLTLDVYRPTAVGPFPAVIQIYGGRWQRGSPEDDSEYARYLATRGYVVFAIDYRHAPRWRWPAQLEDVRTAIAWVRLHAADYGADVSRLAVLGRSAGAQLALLAAYEPGAPEVQAVVSYYGPVDLADGYRHPPSPDPLDVRAIDEALIDGTPDSAPDRYRDASPITRVTRPLPPTLLIAGARDHIVEARFGRMLHDRLVASGTTSALLEIPWAEHAFDAVPGGVSGQIALYYTERFLAWALTR